VNVNPESVPRFVLDVLEKLQSAGHEGYLVGGCVRDLVMGKKPSDFDVATRATPAEVERLFERSVPVGERFGTVLVLGPPESGTDVHVTTYRSEGAYKDGRRPSEVRFARSIHEDLSRRDFTMNAMAWNPLSGELVDPFEGRADIENRLIRAVGDPEERMREDLLRTLRAVRFSAQFGFDIEEETWRAIERNAAGVRRLSAERVRDELLKLLEAPHCERALWTMAELGLLQEILPELKGAARLAQHKRGAPTLLDHLIQTAAACPADGELRLAGLVHDIGKLATRAIDPSGRVTFHGHTASGAETARAIARRLKLPKASAERIASLVEMHMSLGPELTKKGLRRWVARRGAPWVRDLISLARADALASGWEEPPPHLGEIERSLEEIVRAKEAFTKQDLAVSGRDVMEVLGIGPGPKVGEVLDLLYEHVLEHPEQNTKDALIAKMKSL